MDIEGSKQALERLIRKWGVASVLVLVGIRFMKDKATFWGFI